MYIHPEYIRGLLHQCCGCWMTPQFETPLTDSMIKEYGDDLGWTPRKEFMDRGIRVFREVMKHEYNPIGVDVFIDCLHNYCSNHSCQPKEQKIYLAFQRDELIAIFNTAEEMHTFYRNAGFTITNTTQFQVSQNGITRIHVHQVN